MIHRLTITEAAAYLGVSTPTIRRLISTGRIVAYRYESPHGNRWEITREALEAGRPTWLDGRPLDQPGEQAGSTQEQPETHPDQPGEPPRSTRTDAPDQPGSPNPDQPRWEMTAALLAALDAAARADQRLEEERRRADLAERQLLEAQYQSRQYQRALSESADSLVEERALRRAAEISAAMASTTPAVQDSPPQNVDGLKTGSSKRGWGQRLGLWLLGQRTG